MNGTAEVDPFANSQSESEMTAQGLVTPVDSSSLITEVLLAEKKATKKAKWANPDDISLVQVEAKSKA